MDVEGDVAHRGPPAEGDGDVAQPHDRVAGGPVDQYLGRVHRQVLLGDG
jgi:hypothetical protein